jgi:hypothetical protein
MMRRTAKVAAALVVAGGTLMFSSPAHAADVECETWTSGGAAYAYCTIYSGQARVRADCKLAADHYSSWYGRGQSLLSTTPCPWGIRGVIVETRY